jgi:hypothetical protein
MVVVDSTDVKEQQEEQTTVGTFLLHQNYPNPFNPEASIKYALHKDREVEIVVYNILGQDLRTLADEPRRAGSYEIIWDGRDDKGIEMASGICFYRLKAGNYMETKKMLLLK